MRFTSTILQTLLVAQAVSFGAAKGKGYSSESSGKGKGGYSSSSSSGKGKGGYSSESSGKGKGYIPDYPTHKEPEIDCDAVVHALNDNIFKSVGAAVMEGAGIGMRLLFSKNPVFIGEEADIDADEIVAFASGICTVVGILDADADIDGLVERPNLHCQVTVDVGDVGSITHQGTLDGGLGDVDVDADLIDDDELVVTGGSKCFEGIVGTAEFEGLFMDMTDPEALVLTLLLGFDVRI